MKKTVKTIVPYIIVAVTTFVVIIFYLFTEAEGLHEKKYTFERTFIDDDVLKIIDSKICNTDTAYTDIRELSSIETAVGLAEVDSSQNYIALVRPDKAPYYIPGIYKYDKTSKSFNLDSCLCPFNMPDNYADHIYRLLAYNCTLTVNSDNILITFLHFSDIIILNHDGTLRNRMKTKDNVPPPSVLRNGKYTVYERGKAFNTNRAAFLYKSNLFVLSLRTSERLNQYLIDCYDITSGEYLYSFYVNNAAREDNLFVRKASISGKVVTIESKNCITKFEMI